MGSALFQSGKYQIIEKRTLGWGQIQIADANRISVVPQNSRKAWMLELCDAVLEFYPREIAKIEDRVERFREIRAFWEAKPDD